MKNGFVVLNVILLIAVGVLFYLHFSSETKGATSEKITGQKNSIVTDSPNSCKIAYFEMDSVAENFEKAKEMQTELEKKEDEVNAEMNRLQNLYQQKYINLQQHASSMTT